MGEMQEEIDQLKGAKPEGAAAAAVAAAPGAPAHPQEGTVQNRAASV